MNKIERMLTVFKGETPDKIPAGFWFHYNGGLSVDEMVDAHMELYKKTDMDIIKLMQDYPYAIIGDVKEPSDWYNLKMPGTDCPEFKKLAEVIKKTVAKVNGEVLVFQTMFGPFKAASMFFGDELLMKHSKENPNAVAAGIKIIADGLAQWAKGYLEAGADGIYYSAQFGEVGRFTYDEWAKLVMPSDVQILEVAKNIKNKYNILHICGEPEYDFKSHVDRYGNYPADIVNWSVKDNCYELERGRDFFKRAILGGLNNKGNILNGSDEDIKQEVLDVINTFGVKGLMVGADCTVQGKNISLDKIQTAVQAAHDFLK